MPEPFEVGSQSLIRLPEVNARPVLAFRESAVNAALQRWLAVCVVHVEVGPVTFVQAPEDTRARVPFSIGVLAVVVACGSWEPDPITTFLATRDRAAYKDCGDQRDAAARYLLTGRPTSLGAEYRYGAF